MSTANESDFRHQARKHLRQREFSAACDIYNQMLADSPDSIEAHEGLAMTGFLSGDYELAIREFTRLTNLDPLQARHCINLGAVHNRVGDYTKAIEALRKAIQRDRRSAEAYYNMGIAHRRLKQMPLAVSAYKEAVRLNPGMAEAYQNLGNVYTETKNYPLAIANFKKALEISPDFEKARVGLEKAEDAAQQAKASFNPFGRLVPSDASSMRIPMGSTRVLSAEDRLQDRQTVRRLAEELNTLVHDCNDFLRGRLVPAILDLEKSAAEGNFMGLAYGRAARQFVDSYESWVQLRGQLSQKFAELRAHDASMSEKGDPGDS